MLGMDAAYSTPAGSYGRYLHDSQCMWNEAVTVYMLQITQVPHGLLIQHGSTQQLTCLLICRVLHLLLQAAGVQAGQTTVNPFSSSDILATNPIGALNSCCWTESHVVLLKAVLDTSPQLISAQLDAVVTAVRAAAQQQTLRKSTAFGQLLMALTNNYKAVVNLQQVEQLEAAAAATDTFLTRAVKSKLQQLKAQHAAANSR